MSQMYPQTIFVIAVLYISGMKIIFFLGDGMLTKCTLLCISSIKRLIKFIAVYT